MSPRVCLAGIVALSGLAALSPALGAPAKPAFTVRSSLAGMTVLPHRIHWLGAPSLTPSQIREVDFLIDGRPGWVEHKPPYVFGEDIGPHRGYLVTSWLSPGRHRFVVKAIAKDGRTALATTTARVLPAPTPPAALAGVWRRDIPDTSAAPTPGSAGNPTDSFTPPGVYTMVIDKRWIRQVQPGTFKQSVSDKTGAGWVYVSDYTPGRKTFRVYGSVSRFPFNDAIADGGGSWCYPDGPPADYAWSVSGDTLTLTPSGGPDPCGIRGFVWAGQWTRGG